MITNKHVQFSLGALLLVVLAVEAASWVVWETGIPENARNNIRALSGSTFFGPQKLPNTFWHHTFNPEHPKYEGQVNASGFKGDDFPVEKPAGEFRVICLGNSTVEGTGVDPDETLPAFLQATLQQSDAVAERFTAVRVINAGIGSHNSAFNLAHLAFRLIHYQPDLVVIKSSYNDYLPYCIPGMDVDYTHAFPNPFTLKISRGPFWTAAGYSYFLSVLGSALYPARVANPFPDFSGWLTPEQFQRMDYSMNADKFFVYAENIRSMILLCRGRGIDVVLLDLPTSPDDSHFGADRFLGEGFRDLIARLEVELHRIAREENVPLVSTPGLTASDFQDHCHNTPEGHRKIAATAAAVISGRIAIAGERR